MSECVRNSETEFKLVGIQVNEKLTWRSNIDYISRKIEKNIPLAKPARN